uniref:Uncharacterized protein n=1 Tax=Arundo donax TaxID=35708 RepID=A0A0A9EJT3_ARUDO
MHGDVVAQLQQGCLG